MNSLNLLSGRAVLVTACMLSVLGTPQPGFSQQVELIVPTSLTHAEARVIIDEAMNFARQRKGLMSVVVMDNAGAVVAADRMDGVSGSTMRFAEGKAFASLNLRQTTEYLGALAKTRPDRYFGIMTMYPGQMYLVGGGVPLVINDQVVGAVGIAGLSQGVDEQAARAGMAAWDKYRASRR